MLHHFLHQTPFYHVRGWNPSRLGQNFLWMLAADATNTGDGTDVTQWISHEGNNYLFTTSTNPMYNVAGNNSRPTVEFDLGEYVEYSQAFFQNDGFTMSMLVNVNSSGTYTYLYQADTQSIQKQFAVRTIDGYINVIQNNGGVESSILGTTQMSGWHLITIHSDGIKVSRRGIASRPIATLDLLIESLTIRIDGVQESLRGENSSGWFGAYDGYLFKIGDDLDGEIQQLLVFPSRLSDVNQDSLESYLNTYGGL
jgi:hypothetical protein